MALVLPSPADAPTEHDGACSAWIGVGEGDTARLAPVDALPAGLQPVKRVGYVAWPTPETPTTPIAVELVRTSDDRWHVLVDGQMCAQHPDDAKEAVCALPPPFDPKTPINSNTRPRTVAVAVRLEREALRPEKVELVTEQIIDSEERRDPSGASRFERQDGRRVALQPYAVGDASVGALSVGYPFIAPAQSALGILSLNELRRWEERVGVVQRRLFANAALPKVLADAVKGLDTNEQKKDLAERYSGPEPPNETTRTHVIGGMTTSAPRAVAGLVANIVRVCENVRAEDSKRKAQRRTNWSSTDLGTIRVALIAEGMANELAFLDTLNRPTRDLNPTNSSTIPGPQPVDGKESLQFLYNRLSLDERIPTVLRLEHRLEVTELSGAVRIVRLRPTTENHGMAAHAALTRLVDDIYVMNDALDGLLACIKGEAFDPKKRPRLQKLYDGLPAPAESTKAWWKSLWDDPATKELDERSLIGGISNIRVMCSEGIFPVWPPVEELESGDGSSVDTTAVAIEVDAPTRRVLPQVVHPTAVYPALLKPVDTAPPDDFARLPLKRLLLKVESSGMVAAVAVGVLTSIAYLVRRTFSAVGSGVAAVANIPLTPVGILRVIPGGVYNTLVGTVKGTWNAGVGAAKAARATHRYVVAQGYARNSLDQAVSEKYREAVKLLRGTPVLSCHANATNAVRALRESTDLVYLAPNSARFRFYQWYTGSEAIDGAVRADDDAWDAAPDGAALQLLPPTDVADALFEATALRRVPLAPAVRAVVGAVDAGTPTTPAQLAAVAAHAELLARLEAERIDLDGSHLTASVFDQALRLATEGAALVVAAYGERAGITRVAGDDDYWRCLPGGTAARLALRHLSIFALAEAVRRAGAGAGAGPGADADAHQLVAVTWSRTRRAVVDEFARAWVDEARRMAAHARRAPWPLGGVPDEDLVDAVRALARLQALARDAVAPLAAVAGSPSVAPTLAGARGLQLVAANEEQLGTFSDQRQRTPPVVRPNHEKLAMAIASRRADPAALRAWRPGTGAADLTQRLAGLRVDAAESTSPGEHCYFPLGSRLLALPSSVPFDVSALAARLVWLEHVLVSAPGVAVEPTQPAPPAPGVVRVRHAQQPKGLQRHPLVVGVHDGAVELCYASGWYPDAARGAPDDAEQVVDSEIGIVDAVARIYAPADGATGRRLRTTVHHARSLAFMADRFSNALMLAHVRHPTATVVQVEPKPTDERHRAEMETEHSAVALVMALALLIGETGTTGTVPTLVVENEKQRQQVLQVVDACVTAARRAMDRGCRVVRLAELALAFA